MVEFTLNMGKLIVLAAMDIFILGGVFGLIGFFTGRSYERHNPKE